MLARIDVRCPVPHILHVRHQRLTARARPPSPNHPVAGAATSAAPVAGADAPRMSGPMRRDRERRGVLDMGVTLIPVETYLTS